jgi:hypothetical protein
MLTFPHYGDSVASTTWLIIGVHCNTDSDVKPLNLKTPPQRQSPPLASYIWAPFNVCQHAVSYSKDDQIFNRGAVDNSPATIMPDVTIRASEPKRGATISPSMNSMVKYCLHTADVDESIMVRSEVMSLDHLCPPFTAQPNMNLF